MFRSSLHPLLLASLCLVVAAKLTLAGPTDFLDDYNVVWTSQSQNSSESMPCGGGDIGLNVWVEHGDVLFYLSRSGAFDENNLFAKLGRVRLKFHPNPFVQGSFRQELALRKGQVEIQGGEGDARVMLQLWVDVRKPIVHVKVQSTKPVGLEAIYENWRTKERPVGDTEERHGMRAFYHGLVEPIIYPTFWGPGYDWAPDHNWGGSGMIGLQEMLMQTNGREILLFPAWPKAWNVDFKLHAPYGTTVEAELRDGEVKNLKITPEERKKDVKILLVH